MNLTNERAKIIHFFKLTCFIYSIFFLIMNSICWFLVENELLTIWANLIFFVISLIIAIPIYYRGQKKQRNQFSPAFSLITYSTVVFTALTFSLNLLVYMMNNGLIWTIYSIYLMLLYSLIATIVKKLIKINSYLIKSIIYYVITCIFYVLIVIYIGSFGGGNKIFVHISIFTVSFALISVIIYLINKKLNDMNNNDSPYRNQF